MKRLFIAVLIILMVATVSLAKDISVSFTWDPNTEPDMAGYALFQRLDGQAYDYTAPIDPNCTIVDGGCYTNPTDKTNLFTLTLSAPEGQLSKWFWVARAKDTEGQWSEDSNEVFLEVNLTPLASVGDLSAVFNTTTQTIDFTWTQPELARIRSWQLYRGTTQGGPYTSILTIPYDGESTILSASIPADTLAPGGEYYFVIVSFADFGIFSPDSNVVKIDRRPPTKVINLKITLQ